MITYGAATGSQIYGRYFHANVGQILTATHICGSDW